MKQSPHKSLYQAGGSWDLQERLDNPACSKSKGHNRRSNYRWPKDKSLSRRVRYQRKKQIQEQFD